MKNSFIVRQFEFRRAGALALLVCFALCAARCQAQLTWGINGAGGSGTWDAVTANWFDGTQNVVWPSGGNAIFAGASGTVTAAFSGAPVANSIIFNTPGYLIQNGRLLSGPSGLTVTTNADATISATIDSSATTGKFLTKIGPAALTVSGTNFIDVVNVNQGEFRVSGNSSLFFSNVTLADEPTAMVTLGQSGTGDSMGSLSGGGSQGGVVRPDNQARTVTLSLRGPGNFGGTFRDNASGKLAVELLSGGSFTVITGLSSKTILGTYTGTGNMVLTGASTHSGATTVDSGNLLVSGNGSLVNSPMTASSLGLLVLDNSAVANANRVSNSLPFTMENTRVQLIGNSSTPVEEVLGNLMLSGASSMTITKPASAATLLTFPGFARNGHATLTVIGEGVSIAGLANNSTGVVPPMFTAGNEWATIGGDGRLTAFTSYAGDINSGSTGDLVKLAAGGITTLVASTTRVSLNLQNSNAAVDQTLDLGGQSLALTSGGVLTSGNGSATIRNGILTTTAAEWTVTVNNSLTISSPIQQSVGATAFVKTGPGTLTLTGTNTYFGTTAIMQGTLVANSDVNLGTGSTIEFGGGTLLAAGSFSSSKGLTKSSPLVGTIDSGGYNVAFSGANTGAINKIGAGVLTLSNANTGTTFATAGTLVLTNATSGSATLRGGKLQAAGTLSSLMINSTPSPTSTLDLGGPAGATLSIAMFGDSASSLTVDFGIGSAAKDLLSFTNSGGGFPTNASAIQFEFADLGGVTTGVDYTLITFPFTGLTPSVAGFALAPDMAAAGWAGTFKATTTNVSVRFTAVPVPEPETALLLLEGAGLVLFSKRFRASKN